MTRLIGIVAASNVIQYDYCWRECITSLLGVCDEVLVGVAESTDGTPEAIAEMAARDPRIRVIWCGDVKLDGTHDRDWYDRWLNHIRSHADVGTMLLYLDCDEVLGPESHDALREATKAGVPRWLNYVNFWSSANTTSPWGDGRQLRFAPQEFWHTSHSALPAGEADAKALAPDDAIKSIYHYTMLRRPEALYAKCRFLGMKLEGWEPDKLLIRAEAEGVNPTTYFTDKEIFQFTGSHPPVILDWLRERGHCGV